MRGVWRSLASGWTGAAWSPAGTWLLVWQQPVNGQAEDATLWIDRPNGSIVQQFDGLGAGGVAAAAWFDPTTFVVRKGDRNVLGTVGSQDLALFPAPTDAALLSNERGAIAWYVPGDPLSDTRFRVWTRFETTTPQAGLPAAWSHDGRKLAVWHWLDGSGPTSTGWIEVLRWPELDTVAAMADESVGLPVTGAVVFDPSDRYLYDGHIHDLAAGATVIPTWPELIGGVVWDGDTHLVGAGLETGRAFVYDTAGMLLSTTEPLGNNVAASADGATLVFWYAAEARPITIQRRAGQAYVEVPGPVQPYVLLSANGGGLVVGTGTEPTLLVSEMP